QEPRHYPVLQEFESQAYRNGRRARFHDTALSAAGHQELTPTGERHLSFPDGRHLGLDPATDLDSAAPDSARLPAPPSGSLGGGPVHHAGGVPLGGGEPDFRSKGQGIAIFFTLSLHDALPICQEPRHYPVLQEFESQAYRNGRRARFH